MFTQHYYRPYCPYCGPRCPGCGREVQPYGLSPWYPIVNPAPPRPWIEPDSLKRRLSAGEAIRFAKAAIR